MQERERQRVQRINSSVDPDAEEPPATRATTSQVRSASAPPVLPSRAGPAAAELLEMPPDYFDEFRDLILEEKINLIVYGDWEPATMPGFPMLRKMLPDPCANDVSEMIGRLTHSLNMWTTIDGGDMILRAIATSRDPSAKRASLFRQQDIRSFAFRRREEGFAENMRGDDSVPSHMRKKAGAIDKVDTVLLYS